MSSSTDIIVISVHHADKWLVLLRAWLTLFHNVPIPRLTWHHYCYMSPPSSQTPPWIHFYSPAYSWQAGTSPTMVGHAPWHVPWGVTPDEKKNVPQYKSTILIYCVSYRVRISLFQIFQSNPSLLCFRARCKCAGVPPILSFAIFALLSSFHFCCFFMVSVINDAPGWTVIIHLLIGACTSSSSDNTINIITVHFMETRWYDNFQVHIQGL